jgi:hypothetical protein
MTMQPMTGAGAPLRVRRGADLVPVTGGMVFQRLTAEYLRIWGEQWWDKAPKELLHLYQTGDRTETDRK